MKCVCRVYVHNKTPKTVTVIKGKWTFHRDNLLKGDNLWAGEKWKRIFHTARYISELFPFCIVTELIIRVYYLYSLKERREAGRVNKKGEEARGSQLSASTVNCPVESYWHFLSTWRSNNRDSSEICTRVSTYDLNKVLHYSWLTWSKI